MILLSNITMAQDKAFEDHILFHCSFDGQEHADFSVGDSLIYTAESYKETDQAKAGVHDDNVVLLKDQGVTGDALYFREAKTAAIYFSGDKNLGYSSESWSGSFSFWLQVDPETELAPSYCDPINLTDTKYNDAALWVDFTKDSPREFRLGVLGDLSIWNPENKNNEAAFEKRLVTVEKPPFKGERWTHVVITYSGINTDRSTSMLYLDGDYKGVVEGINDPFTWEEENAKIMLGLGYIGKIDELTAFDKDLDPEEVQALYDLKGGIKSLLK